MQGAESCERKEEGVGLGCTVLCWLAGGGGGGSEIEKEAPSFSPLFR